MRISRNAGARPARAAVSECCAPPSSGGLPVRSGCTPGKAACRSPAPVGTCAPPDREAASGAPTSARHRPSSVGGSGVRSRASGRRWSPDGGCFRCSGSRPSFVSPSSPRSPALGGRRAGPGPVAATFGPTGVPPQGAHPHGRNISCRAPRPGPRFGGEYRRGGGEQRLRIEQFFCPIGPFAAG